MRWYWIIPISLAIIGYWGIFWTLNLADINISINMDNNTLEAIQSINYTVISEARKEVICFIPYSIFNESSNYKVLVNSNGTCTFIEEIEG